MPITIQKLSLIMAGGALGAAARYFVQWASVGLSKTLPMGTLIANFAGCFLAGFLAPVLLHRVQLSAVVVTGFLGAFTTFSSFALETYRVLDVGKWNAALLYWMLTTIGSVLLCGAGLFAGQKIFT